jgi:type IV secretory pathway VirB4 component
MPAQDAVWVGLHARDGRDVHYSFTHGFDPAQPPPPHAITLILGEMGSGKTSLMRWVMLQRLLQGRTIISIDPEGENSRLCEALGGRVVPAGVPQDPDTCLIHPLQAEEPAEMLLAVRFLLASLAGEHALTPQIQAALHEAVQRRWQRRPGALVAKCATTFSLADLVDSLAAVNIPEAGVAIALLRPYARGGLWEGFFDRPKALLSPDFPHGQWWNFDLSALREENRAIVHAVLAWFLYHAVTIGKKPMDIFIDEGWRLLRSGPFADLLDELGRRARKRGVGVTLITHLPADLARNRTSLSLASTAFIGRLGPEEAFAFFRSLGVSESEARRNAEIIANLPPRVFLAAPAGGRGALFPVLVTIPDTWLQMWNSLGAAR